MCTCGMHGMRVCQSVVASVVVLGVPWRDVIGSLHNSAGWAHFAPSHSAVHYIASIEQILAGAIILHSVSLCRWSRGMCICFWPSGAVLLLHTAVHAREAHIKSEVHMYGQATGYSVVTTNFWFESHSINLTLIILPLSLTDSVTRTGSIGLLNPPSRHWQFAAVLRLLYQ